MRINHLGAFFDQVMHISFAHLILFMCVVQLIRKSLLFSLLQLGEQLNFDPLSLLGQNTTTTATTVSPTAQATEGILFHTFKPSPAPTPLPTSNFKPTKNCKFLGFFCEDKSTAAPSAAPTTAPTELFGTLSPVADLPPQLGGPPDSDDEEGATDPQATHDDAAPRGDEKEMNLRELPRAKSLRGADIVPAIPPSIENQEELSSLPQPHRCRSVTR